MSFEDREERLNKLLEQLKELGDKEEPRDFDTANCTVKITEEWSWSAYPIRRSFP